ncbi:hypothetical protein ACWEQN_47725 [Streptomyces sp. NPDC004129]
MYHDRYGLHMVCVDGTKDVKPEFLATHPAHLPLAAPAALRQGLAELGVTQRLANPWLRDAITTAILRQVVRADQARKLYRAWCSTYGTTAEGPQGELAVAPMPDAIKDGTTLPGEDVPTVVDIAQPLRTFPSHRLAVEHQPNRCDEPPRPGNALLVPPPRVGIKCSRSPP